MSIIHNYCITGKNFQFLEKLNLNIILSGSEDKNLSNYPSTWIKDNEGINISNKNKNFGTLTSHYWLWKNKLDDYSDEDWIGINHYRRFWLNKNSSKNVNISNLSENILREVPSMDKDRHSPRPQLSLMNLLLRYLANCESTMTSTILLTL